MFQPIVRYTHEDADRTNSILKYIVNRVGNNNKNFLCAVTGPTGVGKSWCTGSIAETYSQLTGIKYDPEHHVVFSFKELMDLINHGEAKQLIQTGSIITFDEPQVSINSRRWQSEANQSFNSLLSTFRNKRLVIFFATPYMEFLDKQSRVLFHAEFKIDGFDKNTKLTQVIPRFLDYMPKLDKFYMKRLIIQYKVPNVKNFVVEKLDKWQITKPSDEWVNVYERRKKEFTERLNLQISKDLNKDSKEKSTIISDDFLKFNKIYQECGENYVEILKQMPHLSMNSIDRYLKWAKKSKKSLIMGSNPPS